MRFKSKPGKRYSRDLKNEAVRKYIESDMSSREIAEIYGVGNSTVWRWIANFAKLNPDNARLMEKIRAFSNNYEDGETHQPRKEENKLEEACAPATPTPTDQDGEVARLKEALRRSELKADLYAEMIRVAEARFQINIIKKAGAKQ